MELACPRCGALNRDDAVEFPFCHQCHEPLVKCGYCRFFDVGQVVCEHPRVVQRQVRAETVPDCEFYSPKDRPRTAGLGGRAVPAPGWIAGLALLVVALILVVRQIIPPTPVGLFDGSLSLKVDWPAVIRADQPNVISVTIVNLSSNRNPTGPILVRISRAFFDEFKVTTIAPSLLRQETAGKSTLLWFSSLDPGRSLKVTFKAKPLGSVTGVYQCDVSAGISKQVRATLGELEPKRGSK